MRNPRGLAPRSVNIRRYINYRLDNNKEVNIKVNGEEVEYNKYLNDIA